MNNDPIVDTILLALKERTKTEAEAVAECGDLAKHQLLNWDYLQDIVTGTSWEELVDVIQKVEKMIHRSDGILYKQTHYAASN